MASRPDAPECDSYSWIVAIILSLHSDIIRRNDLTFSCIPQGKLKGEAGTRAPDFKMVLCSQTSPFPRGGNLFGCWEVKNFATKSALKSSKNSLDEHFATAFIAAFPQLKQQADHAFAENPKLQAFRSFFSCGTRFALIESYKSEFPTRPPLDTTCPWMPQYEDNLKGILAEGVASTLAGFTNYSAIQQWLAVHPVDEPGISAAAKRLRQEVESHLDACEATRTGPALPRIYFFGHSIFCGEAAPPRRLHEEFRWRTIRDLSPQFLKAIELVYRSPMLSPSSRITLPPTSLFVPPTDPAVYTPQESNLVRSHTPAPLTAADVHL